MSNYWLLVPGLLMTVVSYNLILTPYMFIGPMLLAIGIVTIVWGIVWDF